MELLDYKNFQKTTGKTIAYCFQEMVITCLYMFDQLLHKVRELMLKNGTLKTAHPV